MRIIWANVPRRFWLWRHMGHGAMLLAGPTWTCSCGSSTAVPLSQEA